MNKEKETVVICRAIENSPLHQQLLKCKECNHYKPHSLCGKCTNDINCICPDCVEYVIEEFITVEDMHI